LRVSCAPVLARVLPGEPYLLPERFRRTDLPDCRRRSLGPRSMLAADQLLELYEGAAEIAHIVKCIQRDFFRRTTRFLRGAAEHQDPGIVIFHR
jgi:hypothetical protein